jgi:hypothetical protein
MGARHLPLNRPVKKRVARGGADRFPILKHLHKLEGLLQSIFNIAEVVIRRGRALELRARTRKQG